MVALFPRIRIYGVNFSPKSIDSGDCDLFSKLHEKGDIAATGRYKGQPLPYGSATITPPKNIEGEIERISWVIEKYSKHRDEIIKCGADDITLHIDVNYKNQCNLAFDADILKKISELNIPFTISCWEEEL